MKCPDWGVFTIHGIKLVHWCYLQVVNRTYMGMHVKADVNIVAMINHVTSSRDSVLMAAPLVGRETNVIKVGNSVK